MLLVKRSGSTPPPWTPASLSNLAYWYKRGTGITARTARLFTAANTEYLLGADSANVRVTNEDFWFSFFVKFNSTGSVMVMFIKGNGTSGANFSYKVRITTTPRIQLEISSGSASTTVNAGTLSPSTGVWYHVYGDYDASAATIRIGVDGAAPSSTGSSVTCTDGGHSFAIGAESDGGQPFDGLIQGLAFGKPSDVTTYAATIQAFFYNSGTGRLPSAMSSTQKSDWGCNGTTGDAWDLTEPSGNAASAVGGNSLTDTNTVTAGDGKVESTAVNGDPVFKFADQSGNGNHRTQPTYSLRPTYTSAGASDGGSGIVFSGTANWMKIPSLTTSLFGTGAYEIAWRFQTDSASGFHSLDGFSDSSGYQMMFDDGGFNNVSQSLFTRPSTLGVKFFNYNGTDTQKAYNGTTESDSDATTDAGTTSGGHYLATYRDVGDQAFDGILVEGFAVDTAVLTTDERDDANTYLAAT